jgi:hypothetical protein
VTVDKQAGPVAPQNTRLALVAGLVPPGAIVLMVGPDDPALTAVLSGGKPELTQAAAPATAPGRPRGQADFDAEAYDAIVLTAPLDPAARPAALLRAVAPALKADGVIVLTCHNALHGKLRLAGLLIGGTARGREDPPTMTWPALLDHVAAAGLTVAAAGATVVDIPDPAPGALPPGVIDWVRAQTGAYEAEYAVQLRRADGAAPARPVTPAPAAPLPASAAGIVVPPTEADAVARIEHLVGAAFDTLQRQDLRHRDALMGAEAAAGTARRDLERLAGLFHRQVKTLRTEYQNREKRLRQEFNIRLVAEREAVARRYQKSLAWRIGRLATLPLRAFKKLARRR